MVDFCNSSVVNVSQGNTIRRLVQQALAASEQAFPQGVNILCVSNYV